MEPRRLVGGNGPNVLGSYRISSPHAAGADYGVGTHFRPARRLRAGYPYVWAAGQGISPVRQHGRDVRSLTGPGTSCAPSPLVRCRHIGHRADTLPGHDGWHHATHGRRLLRHGPVPASFAGEWRIFQRRPRIRYGAARWSGSRAVSCQSRQRNFDALEPPCASGGRARRCWRVRAGVAAAGYRRGNDNELAAGGQVARPHTDSALGRVFWPTGHGHGHANAIRNLIRRNDIDA